MPPAIEKKLDGVGLKFIKRNIQCSSTVDIKAKLTPMTNLIDLPLRSEPSIFNAHYLSPATIP